MTREFPNPIFQPVQSNEPLVRLQEFGLYLRNRGHTPSTRQTYIRCAEHFEYWFATHCVETIDEAAVAHFLKDHLPLCSCSSPRRRSHKEVRASLRHYLASLRKLNLIPLLQSPPLSDVEKEVNAFEQYLIHTCGVALETRIYRVRYVREFLVNRYGTGPVSPQSLQPGEIIKFLVTRAAPCKPGTAKVISASVRSYLKFLVLRGILSNRMLAAVPTIPQWRMSSLPKVLSTTELDRLLTSFNVFTPTGCRDYAMVLCLAELGLRTCEVVCLRLNDINWGEGTIRIADKKSHRERILPLTSSLGNAIADYLKVDRAKDDERALFLRHRAPVGTPVTSHIVRDAVRRACARIGILPPRDGPHTLRHTLATRMLEKGVPLTEVADVLGHQTIDTTAIYTKVNIEALGRVAMPWPEVMR